MNKLSTVVALAGFAAFSSAWAAPFSQDGLPAAVHVPAGNKVALETVGAGDITYECKVKKDTMDQHEWVFVGPDAVSVSYTHLTLPTTPYV